MSITIKNIANGDGFVTGITVQFQGEATDTIVTVKLIADGKFSLGQATVQDSQWQIGYPFNTAGTRKITAQGFDSKDKLVSTTVVNIVVQQPVSTCENRKVLFAVDDKTVWQLPGQTAFFYQTGMEIDADGAANAYHPDNIGVDFLANAGHPGNWWALVTDDDGDPVIQKSDDPFPGYFISTTTLEDRDKNYRDPFRYVDSFKVPFIVLPGIQDLRDQNVHLGDYVAVYRPKNKKLAFAIYADNGQKDLLGEGSIALTRALGHNPFIGSKVQVGIADSLLYVVFPGSRSTQNPWTSAETVADIDRQGSRFFEAWGGLARAKACCA